MGMLDPILDILSEIFEKVADPLLGKGETYYEKGWFFYAAGGSLLAVIFIIGFLFWNLMF